MINRKNRQKKEDNLIFQKPETFKIIAFVLCFTVFAFGFWLGSIDLNPSSPNINIAEKFKIIFPIAVQVIPTALFLLFINVYVKEHIDANRKEYEQKEFSLRRELQNAHIKQQELEFLSIFLEKLNDFPDSFNRNAFCKDITDLYPTATSLKEAIRNYSEKLKSREEALKGLDKGFKEDKNKQFPFAGLVLQACNDALNIQKYQKSAENFYLDIAVFLKAWLVCSIRYGVCLKIEPFYNFSFENNNNKKNKKSVYIDAIKYIQNAIIENKKPIDDYFETLNSRELVSEHLEELIKIMESENTYNVSSTSISH